MKFLKKKEVTLEKTPILFRLERRHTLLDGVKDEETIGDPKRAFRANSVGSYTRSTTTPTSTKPGAAISKLCLSDGNRSNYSAASTVVITESELSSSWLYNTRKAKIDSDEEPSMNTTTSQTEDHDIQPVQIRDPEMKPKPVPLKKRPEKKSSCCCYVLVVITICLASLGIMAAIGGIIYLEVFAVYRNMLEGKNANIKPSSNDAKVMDKSEVTILHPNEGWSLNGFRNLVDKVQDNINDSAEINEDISNKEDLTHNPFPGIQSEKDLDTSEVKLNKNPNVASDFDDQFNKSDFNENSLHHDNDVIEDLLHVDETNHDINDHDYEDNYDIHDSRFVDNDQVTDEHLSNKVNMDVGSEDNPDHEDEDGIKDQSFKTKLDSLESILRQQANSRLPRMEPDSLEVNTDGPNNEDIEYENIIGMEPQNQDAFDDSALDYDLVMNRPIVEAKPPIDFQTRLINNFNKGTDKPLTAEDMEMKFTLSEILKYLRNLDANNQLPATRQSQKSGSEATTSSMSNIDVGSERIEYLSNLRKRIYT